MPFPFSPKSSPASPHSKASRIPIPQTLRHSPRPSHAEIHPPMPATKTSSAKTTLSSIPRVKTNGVTPGLESSTQGTRTSFLSPKTLWSPSARHPGSPSSPTTPRQVRAWSHVSPFSGRSALTNTRWLNSNYKILVSYLALLLPPDVSVSQPPHQPSTNREQSSARLERVWGQRQSSKVGSLFPHHRRELGRIPTSPHLTIRVRLPPMSSDLPQRTLVCLRLSQLASQLAVMGQRPPATVTVTVAQAQSTEIVHPPFTQSKM